VTQNQILGRFVKPVVFLASVIPALILFYLTWNAYQGNPSAWPALTGNLSANPLEDITHRTGDWTIRFLCVTLAITPLRRVTGWNGVIRFRRMAGLFAFFYGTLHFLTWAILDRFLSLDFPNGMLSWTAVRTMTSSIGGDIAMRPFITVGFAAFVAMLPLAATSTAGMIRRLGGRRWQLLHRLVYFSAIAGVVHYWWLVKSDIRQPLMYGVIVAILLSSRVFHARLHRRATTVSMPAARRVGDAVR
jgi:methionine sulfoxide reductase heme-binding subunit